MRSARLIPGSSSGLPMLWLHLGRVSAFRLHPSMVGGSMSASDLPTSKPKRLSERWIASGAVEVVTDGP